MGPAHQQLPAVLHYSPQIAARGDPEKPLKSVPGGGVGSLHGAQLASDPTGGLATFIPVKNLFQWKIVFVDVALLVDRHVAVVDLKRHGPQCRIVETTTRASP